MPVYIDAPPTEKTQIFSAIKAFQIAVDIVGGNKLITATKSNGAWQNIRII